MEDATPFIIIHLNIFDAKSEDLQTKTKKNGKNISQTDCRLQASSFYWLLSSTATSRIIKQGKPLNYF